MNLDKLLFLHTGEEALREESLRRIADSKDMSAHFTMVESGMDLIFALLPSDAVTDADQLILGNLGIRLFNGIAVAVKLMLSGYYQAAALQLRDVLETTFLLDYFSTNQTLVTSWRTMPEADRKRAFKPVTIRTALDDRDQFTGRKRAEFYDLLSKLAGHATPEGMAMLVPDPTKTNVHCGPFLEQTALLASISECAKLTVQAAQAFRKIIADETFEQQGARLDCTEAEANWMEQFYNMKVDRIALAEMRSAYEKRAVSQNRKSSAEHRE